MFEPISRLVFGKVVSESKGGAIMTRKGCAIAIAVFILMPSRVTADDPLNPGAGLQQGRNAHLSSGIPLSPDQRVQKTAYGFADGDLQAARFESLDYLLDAALVESGTGPMEKQNSLPDQQAVSTVEQDVSTTEEGVPTAGEYSASSRANELHLTEGATYPSESVAARFGWWFVEANGAPTKVGEYQGLGSSVFWDVDQLSSDGRQTLDLIVTGLDNESTHLDLTFFDPRLSTELDFQRYLHRLDHDPLTNLGAIGSGEEIVGEDLDVGADHAIRIQDLKLVLKDDLTETTKARVNFHVLRKAGERQSNTMQHCADFGPNCTRSCHVTGRQQRIDWLTVKVEPVVESKVGPVRVEYSRPMRFFSQNDQLLTADYGDFHIYGMQDEVYAVVPESFSQTDRIKLNIPLGDATDLYTTSYIRDTENKSRQTHRKSYGYDVRLTNRSYDGVKLTAYTTLNDQTNQHVPFYLPEEETALAVPTSVIPPYGIRTPINYFRKTIGADAGWSPFTQGSTLSGLSVTAGTEYGRIDRKYAAYVVQIPESPPGPVYDEDRTDYVSGSLGTSLRWSPQLETFVRYRIRANRT
ncbi:MAG: hypothetical protein ACYC6Y_23010, partial [Thermoguttaceae bacterium]